MSIFKKTEKKARVRTLGQAVDTQFSTKVGSALSKFSTTSEAFGKGLERLANTAESVSQTYNSFEKAAKNIRERKVSYEATPDSLQVCLSGDFAEMVRHYALQFPNDRGAQFMRKTSEARFKRTASKWLTMGEIRAWEKSARQMTKGSIALEAMVTDGLAQIADVPDQYNKLARTAKLVATQADFDQKVAELGINGDSIEHRFARAYLAKLAERNIAQSDEGGATPEAMPEFTFKVGPDVDADLSYMDEQELKDFEAQGGISVQAWVEDAEGNSWASLGNIQTTKGESDPYIQTTVKAELMEEAAQNWKHDHKVGGKQAQANDGFQDALCDEFPGFLADSDVNGADLVDWTAHALTQPWAQGSALADAIKAQFPQLADEESDEEVNGGDLVDCISQYLAKMHQGKQAQADGWVAEDMAEVLYSGGKEVGSIAQNEEGWYAYVPGQELPIGGPFSSEDEAKGAVGQGESPAATGDWETEAHGAYRLYPNGWEGQVGHESWSLSDEHKMHVQRGTSQGMDDGKDACDEAYEEATEKEAGKLASFSRVAGQIWTAETSAGRVTIEPVSGGYLGAFYKAGSKTSSTFTGETLGGTMLKASGPEFLDEKEDEKKAAEVEKLAQTHDDVVAQFEKAIQEETSTEHGSIVEWNKAFDMAEKAGWDWEQDSEFTQYALKATPAEILAKGLEHYQAQAGKTAKSYGDVAGIEPAAKDIDRMESMKEKSGDDEEKVLQHAFNMARAIMDSDKALRRGKAAEVVFGGSLGEKVSALFEQRAKEIDGD